MEESKRNISEEVMERYVSKHALASFSPAWSPLSDRKWEWEERGHYNKKKKMPTPITSYQKKKGQYALFILLLLVLFLVSFLFFSQGALESQLSFYRDISFQTPILSSFLPSSPQFNSASTDSPRADSDGASQSPEFFDSHFEEWNGDNGSSLRTVAGEKSGDAPTPGEKLKWASDRTSISPNFKFVERSNAAEFFDSGFEGTSSDNISSVRTVARGGGERGEDASSSAERLKLASNQTAVSSFFQFGQRSNATEFFDSGFEERGSDNDNDSSVRKVADSDGRSEKASPSMQRFSGKKTCDLYVGTWVKDEEHPIYRPGSCPYVDEAYDCQSNGRRDSEYMRWRWKPNGCDLPRFNATDFLVRLIGKRLMLVGDSMNRNQFESLLCLLHEGLTDKSKMYETRGNKITKGRGYFIFKFEDYNCTVEFVRSHFLVKEGTRINGQGNSNPTLSIDRIDKTAGRWKRADILVFNTGHWWTHGKTARGKNYYKEGDQIYPRFDAVEAYRRSLKTWGKWIDENINQEKLVFYRGYSSAHFRGGEWDSGGSCIGETEPILRGPYLDNYPLKMKIVEDVIQEMKFPVILLNVTRLTNFRKDGHPSIYGKNVTEQKRISTRRQDCSHWCLPGVPDTWNELIYASLVSQQTSTARMY